MISVIIPVYNTGRYLPALIESIENQTYQDLEIVFINDGSTDGSESILDAFALKDSRVKVIHQKNGGVSAARNAGLDVATGDYITFADSDDTLEPDLYETLMALVKEYHVEISHCSYNRIQNGQVKPVGNTGKIYLHTQVEALRELTCGSLFTGGCWNKLYSRELFDGIRFDPSLKLSEDELINFQVFSRVDTIVYRDVSKYNYVDSTTSACRNTNLLRKARDHVDVAERIFSLNHHPELVASLRNKRLGAYLELYKALLYAPQRDKLQIHETAEQIRRLKEEGAEFSREKKFMYMLMRSCPPAFRMLYSLYDRIRVID